MNEIIVVRMDELIGFDYVVYPTSYINPLLNKKELNVLLNHSIHTPCTILFDLLLCNGNCFNRFCKATFDGTKLFNESLELVNITNPIALKLIEQYYIENNDALTKGILVENEFMTHKKL